MLFQSVDIDFWHVVALRVNKVRKHVRVSISNRNIKARLWFLNEIRVCIRNNLDIEIHLEQSIEGVTRADDCPLDAYLRFIICLNIDPVILSIEFREVSCIASILHHDIGRVGK